jgi:hypothetical protein
MELGTIYRILRALSTAAAAYFAQVLLTVDVFVKHTEEPDELCGVRSYVAPR